MKHTLNRLSWSTFLMATISPESHSFAWYTTPKLPFPMTLVSVYDTSWGLSGPWPGVATTVVTLPPSLPEYGPAEIGQIKIKIEYVHITFLYTYKYLSLQSYNNTYITNYTLHIHT